MSLHLLFEPVVILYMIIIIIFFTHFQEEKLARMALKPTTEGSIKRKKHAEEKDARPKPPKVSRDRTIRMLLGRLYGDREFLDKVLLEAGD
jgi:hypothetical protein